MDLVSVAKIVAAWGLEGYVQIEPTTHSLERLKQLRSVYLGLAPDDANERTVEDVILRERTILMKFGDITNRTDAEQVRGRFVFVREADMVRPEPGSFFVHEIIGCTVVSTEGRELGVVADVYKLPAQDVWVVTRNDREFMVPAVSEFVKDVDTMGRRVTIRLIEGLIDEQQR